MPRRSFFVSCAVLLLIAASAFGQSQNATLSGTVTDQSGSVVPNATVTCTGSDRQFNSTVKTDADGRYIFANLQPGNYDLSVEAAGFKTYSSTRILLVIAESRRVDPVLQVGDAATKVEVAAEVSTINVDNGQKQEGVAPDVIQELPLLVSAGTPRNAMQFATFLPGVNTGTSVQTFNARINGGLRMGDEAVMDGVSMQEGTMSQSGMVAFFDFATTPDMVEEVRVLTSSYVPEYGTTTGGEMVVTTRHGGDQFHGGAFEYLRNKDFNALQFTNNRPAGDARPKDNENEPGFMIGGPVLIKPVPFIWGSKHKTYFFTNLDWLRSLGGASRHLLSIPSEQERAGNFSDLSIPIYDPKSESIVNGKITRTPFPGNQIPASEQSPLALKWMSFLPGTTAAGAYNNFLAPPISDGILSNQNLYLYRIDYNWSDQDHFFASVWRQHNPPLPQCELPTQICNSNPADPEDAWVSRFNWDHIFSPTILNHFAYGYGNRNEGYGSVPAQNPAVLPMIPNAAAYNASPAANFSASGYGNLISWGNTGGLGALNKTTRPSHIVNDMVTWVRGAHEIKIGFEFRHLAQVFRQNGNQSGTVGFTDLSTALPGTPSGDPYASFLIGAVDNGNLNVWNVAKYGAQQLAYTWHVGDVWKASRKLTLNYGLRWDRFTPTVETGDHLAFLSFAPNPDAGNLPGSLAFAGNKWGAASFGKPYPENVWNGGFGPRVGAAYRLDEKTVVRAGYGVFYTQAFYPGWSGGMNLDGFNPAASWSDSLSGYEPRFYLDNGFPAYSKAENISQGADNGHSPQYRPTYANHLSYTQQWNLTVERKITNSSFVSLAYVGNKGTHLPSQLQPLNYLNPSLLTSMGSTELNTVFQPGQTSLYGVSVPYANWVQQLNAGGCSPTVAQALVAYPQFCGGLIGLNENQGVSLYNAFQVNFQKNFSNGVYVQTNYTYSRLTTDASSTTQATANYGHIGGVINPYQGSRNSSLSPDDIPHVFALMGTYDLPFGNGKRWLNHTGPGNYFVGGWILATSMKLTSGMPFYFQNSNICGVPSQFQAQCLPGITGHVMAQSWGSINVNQPIFNASAFEPSSMFASGNYLGTGPRVSSVRGSPYRDVNLSIGKKFSIKEHANFEFRGEIFNLFNNHYFTCDGQAFGDCIPFNNDPSSSSFGTWNGTVTQPRNIQLVGRFTF